MTFRYLHYHTYIQLVNRLTMKQTKTLLESDKISFPKGVLLKGDSKQARDYLLKYFGRCMIHHDEEKGKYCKCDFFKLEISNCKICTDDCQQYRKNEILNEEGAIIYQFGKYRYMTGNSDDTIDKINNNNLEDQEKKKYIIENQIKPDQIILNPELMLSNQANSYSELKKIDKCQEKLKTKQSFITKFLLIKQGPVV